MDVLYYSFIESYDYHIWYDHALPMAPQNVSLYRLSDHEKATLAKGSTEMAHKLPLVKWVESCIADISTPLFVRLSGTSGKNKKSLRPLQDADDIVRFLVSNPLFVEQEYNKDKPTYVIMMPWIQKMQSKCEFRLFRYRGKITGLSQQYYTLLFQFSTGELNSIQQAIHKADFTGYPENMVADIWIDFNTSTCHLIECNPYGSHCGAGSSLFHWIEDHDVLIGKSEPEFRYLSIIKCT